MVKCKDFSKAFECCQVLSTQILFSMTFQDSLVFSMTFQACANPGEALARINRNVTELMFQGLGRNYL